jgi:hypothetical protein
MKEEEIKKSHMLQCLWLDQVFQEVASGDFPLLLQLLQDIHSWENNLKMKLGKK